MNIHYLINSQGQTEGVVVPLALWQQMLAILEKSPESTPVLMNISHSMPKVTSESIQEQTNPLAQCH